MTVVDLFSPARDPQEEAADPTLSVFVTANAGSGKTKTLIDRVARLLLAKAKPETILCVTYTKAAASEMQRRLYERLGGWSVASDAVLRQELGKLRSRAPASFDRQDLSEARSLFAAALETPGGLKIQTLHAFCEKVLKRFPLEAGVPPGFRVMDEAAAAAVAAAARKAVAHHVLNVPGELADAYGRLAISLDFRRFQAMFAEFENRRGAWWRITCWPRRATWPTPTAASPSRSTSAASRRCSPSSRTGAARCATSSTARAAFSARSPGSGRR